MASPAQTLTDKIVTNQQNAQHSTGPRTPDGKRQSSVNAITHGLTSQTVVLTGEDPQAYAALRTSLFRDMKPVGAVEDLLVQTVCDTQWRLERARALEANLVALAHYEEVPAHLAAIEDPAQRAALITAHGYDKRENTIRNLQLQAARLERTLFKALVGFHQEQEFRISTKSRNLSQAVLARAKFKAARQPFRPALFGFDFTDAELDREELLHPPIAFPSMDLKSMLGR